MAGAATCWQRWKGKSSRKKWLCAGRGGDFQSGAAGNSAGIVERRSLLAGQNFWEPAAWRAWEAGKTAFFPGISPFLTKNSSPLFQALKKGEAQPLPLALRGVQPSPSHIWRFKSTRPSGRKATPSASSICRWISLPPKAWSQQRAPSR